MNPFFKAFVRLSCIAGFIVTGGGGVAPAAAATLTDFGYGRMTSNGQAAVGTRPLMLILVNYQDLPSPAHNADYFKSLIFNTYGSNNLENVNGFFAENSNGKFDGFTLASAIGPLNVTPSEHTSWQANGLLFLCSNIVYRAVQTNSAAFKNKDANHDNVVSNDELVLVVFTTAGGPPLCCGANLYYGYVPSPDGTFWVGGSPANPAGTFANLNYCASFATICHELTHRLGAIDLYSTGTNGNVACLDNSVSLMSCTCGGADLRNTVHLDPWHKLELGWNQPRIRSLRAAGTEILYAPQTGSNNAAVLLYDPLRGTQDYFLLEYRTTNLVNGSVYDTNVFSEGLAIWQVQLDANKDVARVPSLVNPGAFDAAVFCLAAPDLSRGGSPLWTSNSRSPPFRWLDASPTTTSTFVHPFSPGASQATIDWSAEMTTWVDFPYSGSENGSFPFPFNTLGEGITSVVTNGTVMIKSGSTAERPRITKPMLINAYNGPASIGR